MNNINYNDINNIGNEVKRLRKEKGWTQKRLAELSGLDRTTVGAFERNDYSDIGIRKVQRVLQLLGRSITLTTVGLPTLDDLQNKNNMITRSSEGES
ncbi:MAG: transcriptional regulator [Gammaproteobacteria bacterium]|nr:MAG: transcriptional regulator [Gammaproteobacteria bacterium]